ncbi:periplasmic sensor hybrid histidine kinase [Plesiocystis pacifica SIR-1]|uniref:histidine kinase n=1 Tax=Plesiocystis pacifica SIR-1 TaxID=391625 RepID=A6G0K1_9BACT|nr:ATP-binding protein [Plesiocystis pacifica]EDM80647.1 periplasmic sensor hybrid histidine kinase [Plesiocystis pacifica SIR-1]
MGRDVTRLAHADAQLDAWRALIARRLLSLLAGAGGVLMLVFASTLTPVSLAVGLLSTGALAGVALWQRVPTMVRGALLLLVLAYAGGVSLLVGADVGAGILYLFTGQILAVVLLGWRAGMAYLVFGAGLLGFVAWSRWADVVLVPDVPPPLEPWAMLGGNAASLLILGSITIVSIAFLMGRLRESLAEQTEALNELEQAHATLQQAQEQLVSAGKMELLGQLAGGIAHDMNNALTVVLGEAGLLYDQAPEEAEAITDAVEHASSLTRQLLAMGRREVVQVRPIALASTLERACAMLRRTLPKDITVELSVAEPAAVRADPNQIQQLTLNLGTNAAHAMTEGGVLRVRVDRAGERAVLVFEDTGSGMDELTQARIFEPFFTTKAVGMGTGLGLPSVRGIVESLGGQIECHSALGEGTRFVIELPGIELAEVEGSGASMDDDAALRLDGRRVLVVDDDVRVRAVVTATLAGAGARVTDAGDITTARTLAEQTQEPFELLWTDVVMAGGGGGELVAWFIEHSPSTRVLVCTGYSDDEVLRRDVALGHYTLVNKPFSRGEALRACVDTLAVSA